MATATETPPQVPAAQEPNSELSLYERIADPLAAIKEIGNYIYQSKMFGCTMPAQGQVLAMTALSTGQPIVSLIEQYHIMGGKLSMKAEAMLASLRRRGGDHEVISHTADVAEVKLLINGRSYVSRFTWKEAQEEPFIWGAPDPKTKVKELKTNWATPRARAQMLWARAVSDGVRILAPECCSGLYTPEENADYAGIDLLPIDAEFSRVDTDAKPETATTPSEPPATPTTPPSPGQSPTTTDTVSPDPVTPLQIEELKKLKSALNLSGEQWKSIAATPFGVDSAAKLNVHQARSLIAWLNGRVAECTEAKRALAKNEMDEWVESVVNAAKK